jgi:hypothetical protein
LKFNYEVIPHNEQRYETVGDWYAEEWDFDGVKETVIQFRVSEMSNPHFELLVFIHEFVEFMIEFGVRRKYFTHEQPAIAGLVAETDVFDQRYEAKRTPDDRTSEPGYVPTCPVYLGHMAASAIEHVAAMILGVNYNDYAKKVASLRKD